MMTLAYIFAGIFALIIVVAAVARILRTNEEPENDTHPILPPLTPQDRLDLDMAKLVGEASTLRGVLRQMIAAEIYVRIKSEAHNEEAFPSIDYYIDRAEQELLTEKTRIKEDTEEKQDLINQVRSFLSSNNISESWLLLNGLQRDVPRFISGSPGGRLISRGEFGHALNAETLDEVPDFQLRTMLKHRTELKAKYNSG